MSENNQTKSKSKAPTGRGGARKGAGRKPGSATTKTREIAEKAMKGGITPLEYMLKLMRAKPRKDATVEQKIAAIALQFEAAKAAAPYIHPKLQAIEHSGGLVIRSLAEELAGLNGQHADAV